jgi:hypothetical protein
MQEVMSNYIYFIIVAFILKGFCLFASRLLLREISPKSDRLCG